MSGYSRTQVRNFVVDSLKGYEKLNLAQVEGTGRIHTGREATQKDRELSRMLDETDWWKKTGGSSTSRPP